MEAASKKAISEGRSKMLSFRHDNSELAEEERKEQEVVLDTGGDEEAHSEQVSGAASGMQLADGAGSDTAATLVPTNPLMVDEWASFESSGPASSNPGVSGVTLPVLDEQHFTSE